VTEHKATIRWTHSGEEFTQGKYYREHTWSFDGGAVVPASPSPAIVPAPWSNPASVDPEEAYVASISSCHMLFYLELCRHAGIDVASYEDEAVGKLAKNASGATWVSNVTLRPRATYRGEAPSKERQREIHERAHARCFIASSVKTEIVVEIR
jgi:organic hydroperoxide reductase OsmC/OhrA